jgi:hypothetical protein
MSSASNETDGSEPPILLDVSRFTDRQVAIKIATSDFRERYIQVSRSYPPNLGWTNQHVLFRFLISRFVGTHEAILREIEFNNPHAVFPLLRAYFEAMCVLLISVEKPEYPHHLLNLDSPEDGPSNKFTEIFKILEPKYLGLMNIYNQLSKISHPQELAAINVFMREFLSDGSLTVKWSERPYWQREEDLYLVCAHLEEFALLALSELDEYGRKYLK